MQTTMTKPMESVSNRVLYTANRQGMNKAMQEEREGGREEDNDVESASSFEARNRLFVRFAPNAWQTTCRQLTEDGLEILKRTG